MFSRMHGASLHPVRQGIRQHDGVRGVFLRRPLKRGGLVMSVPLSYVYVTDVRPVEELSSRGTHHALRSSFEEEAMEKCTAARLRRLNRGKELFPEAWTWMQRLSPDSPAERFSLTASRASSCGHPGSVVEVRMSPVTAALAVSIALRYFFHNALQLPDDAARRLHHRRIAGLLKTGTNAWTRATDAITLQYMAALPMALLVSHGVESLFLSSGDDASEHVLIEQLAYTLRDACLTYASSEEYRWMDENPSLLDTVLLAACYLVISRQLAVSVLSSTNQKEDTPVRVFAPGLDMLNHASSGACTSACAISPAQSLLVVRATRDLLAGEEVTLDYGADTNVLSNQYLMGAEQRSLGSFFDAGEG